MRKRPQHFTSMTTHMPLTGASSTPKQDMHDQESPISLETRPARDLLFVYKNGDCVRERERKRRVQRQLQIIKNNETRDRERARHDLGTHLYLLLLVLSCFNRENEKHSVYGLVWFTRRKMSKGNVKTRRSTA